MLHFINPFDFFFALRYHQTAVALFFLSDSDVIGVAKKEP